MSQELPDQSQTSPNINTNSRMQTTENVFFTENFKKENQKVPTKLTQPPPHLSEAMRKKFGKKNISKESEACPALRELLIPPAKNPAPKVLLTTQFQNSNFGGKKPPPKPNQSDLRSNFFKASKKSDWIAP